MTRKDKKVRFSWIIDKNFIFWQKCHSTENSEFSAFISEKSSNFWPFLERPYGGRGGQLGPQKSGWWCWTQWKSLAWEGINWFNKPPLGIYGVGWGQEPTTLKGTRETTPYTHVSLTTVFIRFCRCLLFTQFRYSCFKRRYHYFEVFIDVDTESKLQWEHVDHLEKQFDC